MNPYKVDTSNVKDEVADSKPPRSLDNVFRDRHTSEHIEKDAACTEDDQANSISSQSDCATSGNTTDRAKTENFSIENLLKDRVPPAIPHHDERVRDLALKVARCAYEEQMAAILLSNPSDQISRNEGIDSQLAESRKVNINGNSTAASFQKNSSRCSTPSAAPETPNGKQESLSHPTSPTVKESRPFCQRNCPPYYYPFNTFAALPHLRQSNPATLNCRAENSETLAKQSQLANIFRLSAWGLLASRGYPSHRERSHNSPLQYRPYSSAFGKCFALSRRREIVSISYYKGS